MAIETPAGDCNSSSSSSGELAGTRSPSSSSRRLRLRLVHFSNEFPHDDLRDLLRRLHNHSKDRGHALLASFIVDATLAVREEVRQLPAQLKALVPTFTSILDFADHPDLRKGPLAGAVEGILLCVVELATFIGCVSPFLSFPLLSYFCSL